MNIKLDPADKLFSQYIRLRDKECMRCHSQVRVNDKGLPISHQASHYFGRGRESTRFDEMNVDCLCGACHRLWGSDEREAYRRFKVKQLGVKGFDDLVFRSELLVKRDRKMQQLIWKERLKELL